MTTRERQVAESLARGGFVAAELEAAELVAAAGGDDARLEELLARRLTGEPLSWVTGRIDFCGVSVRVDPGVYEPRWQTEALAERAAERLPPDGTAVDLCTGSGAVGAVLRARRPGARVLGSDADARAVACARANGVEAYEGDLFEPLPVRDGVDVVAGVVPYVPTGELRLLQRDTFTFETPLAYDGGPDGLAVLRRAARGARDVLRVGGALLLELGGDEAQQLDLAALGYADVRVHRDEEGDVRGVEATLGTGDQGATPCAKPSRLDGS